MANVPYCSVDIIRVKIGVVSSAMPLFKKLQNVYQKVALTGSESLLYLVSSLRIMFNEISFALLMIRSVLCRDI